MILIYISCFILLLYYLYTKNYNYWESRKVPYEKPFFIFGNLYDVVTRKKHLFTKFREFYTNHTTPYVGVYIFNQPNLVIRSPELVKKILVKDFDKFVNRQFAINESVDPIASHSMFSAKDHAWRNVRTKITPVFTSGKMKLMLPLMKECGTNLVEHLQTKNNEIMDMRNVMRKYAVDIISSCAFGINSYCLKNDGSKIMDVATKLSDVSSFFRSVAIFSYFFAPKLVDIFRFTFLDKDSVDFLVYMFNDTMNERKKQNILRNDFIDLLNNLKDTESRDGFKFDNVKMASQAITFFSAGNDTTSLSISYTLYELALNTKIQDRLRQEVSENFQKYGDFTYEGLQEMKYLDMVLNETLRKYPLTIFLNRKSIDKYTFEETGLTIDKDLSIMINVAGLHYDPEYFPDPERYDPERFSDENKHKIHPYSYLPFGDGPRNCIGQRFGILVSKVALAYAIKNFAFEKTSSTEVPLKFNPSSLFLLPKSGLNLRVVKCK